MNDNIDNYMSAKDAAKEIGIKYTLLMARVYKGYIKVKKMGWGTVIRKDEVARVKKEQLERVIGKNADNEDME